MKYYTHERERERERICTRVYHTNLLGITCGDANPTEYFLL